MLPRGYCHSQTPEPLLDPDRLKVIWFEEGNGAALIEQSVENKSQTLAVIPPWSGVDGFAGYAAGCCAESVLCWPLPDNPKLQQRIDQAEEFWHSFSGAADPFLQLQQSLLQAYNQYWNTEPIQYYAINGEQFPPRGLAHYRLDNCQILTTIAMSLCPQPMVELQVENPGHYRRVELAIHLHADMDSEQVQTVASRMSGLASYPWRNFTWLGHGHTLDFANVLPNVDKIRLTHDVADTASQMLQLPKFRSDRINLLWLDPMPE